MSWQKKKKKVILVTCQHLLNQCCKPRLRIKGSDVICSLGGICSHPAQTSLHVQLNQTVCIAPNPTKAPTKLLPGDPAPLCRVPVQWVTFVIGDPGLTLVAENKVWFTGQRRFHWPFCSLDKSKVTIYSTVTQGLCVEMHLSSGDKIMNETVSVHLNTANQ